MLKKRYRYIKGMTYPCMLYLSQSVAINLIFIFTPVFIYYNDKLWQNVRTVRGLPFVLQRHIASVPRRCVQC